MKRLSKVLLTACLALTCLPACAGHKDRGYVKARVISASPIYETVRYPVDERVCWVEQNQRRPHRSAVPIVLGGVVGGVVGNQFGDGRGQIASTVAGVAIGGAIGYSASHSYRTTRPRARHERCEIQRHWRTESRLAGWDVTYRHHGTIYHTRTREEPGNKIRVQAYR